MFNFIIKFVLSHRIFVSVCYLFLILFGMYSVSQLPIDVLPDLNRPRVTIFSDAEGLGTEEVEKIVTWPLERIFSNIPWVEAVRSSSAQGISVINVEFGWETKNLVNRQQIFERLQNVSLPESVHTTVAPESALLWEIMWVGLTAKNSWVSQADLRNYAETTLRQELSTIPWVSNLLVMGGSTKQYTIALDPQKMVSKKLTLEGIEKSLANITNPGWAGVIVGPMIELPVSLKPTSPAIQDLANLPVGKNADGSSILVSEIGNITYGTNAQRRWDALIDGKPGVIVRISKVPNANTVALSKSIEAKVEVLQKELPAGYRLHNELFKQTWFIEKWLKNVEEALRDAAIIVGIVVLLFLLSFRTAFITLITLPVTLLMSAIVFHAFWIGINIMILWGLTIAIWELVDDAIVDMENIYRRLRENAQLPVLERKNWSEVIFQASREVRWSVIYATLLQLIVFTPFLMLPGIDGKILAPIGIAYIVSMIMSLVTAVTLVPVLCSWLLPNWIAKKIAQGKVEEDTFLTKGLKRVARVPIVWSLNNPWKALLLALISLPITGLMYLWVTKEWLPSFNESSYTVWITTKPGSSLDYTIGIAKDFSASLQKIDGVTSASTIIGRADADAHAQGSNNAEIEVALEQNITNEEKLLVYEQINASIEKFKGVAVMSVWQPITHRVEEIISGIRAPLVIKIYWEDLDVLQSYGKTMLEQIKTVPWTLNPSLEPQTKIPSLSVSPSLTSQSLYNIPYPEVKDTLEIAVKGKEIAQILDGALSYPLILTYGSNWKSSPEKLASIPIISPSGQQLSLGNLAKLEVTETRNLVSHENGRRRIVISGYTQDRSIVDVVNDIKKKVESNPPPAWLTISYEGLYQAQAESARLLSIVGILVLFSLAGVLYWHFGSVSIVGQILLGVGTGWLWGMIGVWLSGGILSTAHMVGFISLMGIVARNGIMLIDNYRSLAKEAGYLSDKIIIQGSLERIVPVMMTALSAILGLLPLVLWAGDAGKEILTPIATVIFWGLLVSTLIEIVIRPGIFYRFNRYWITAQK